MRIDDDYRDLEPLRPRADDERWVRMVERIEHAAAPELARRAAFPAPGLLSLLSSWGRPALSAAVVAALLALVAMPERSTGDSAGAVGLGEALGYPDAVSAWVETDWTPSVEELLVAMESEP